MSELERDLRSLGAEMAFPETPDLVSLVSGRLPAAAAAPYRRPRRLVLVLAAIVAVAVVAGLAVPQTRAEILRFFGLGAVKVELVDRLPAVEPVAPLVLGEPIDVEDAPFPILTSSLLGAPDHVFADGDVVTLLWGSNDEVRLLVTQIGFGAAPANVVKKLAASSTQAEFVPIEGKEPWALWIAGEPHVVGLPGAPPRLAANTLVWTRGPLTLRLEGATVRDEAVRIAESFR